MVRRWPKQGARLVQLREALGLTQELGAIAAGVSLRSWQRFESGDKPIPDPVLVAFANAVSASEESVEAVRIARAEKVRLDAPSPGRAAARVAGKGRT